jgi:hypothetical protein
MEQYISVLTECLSFPSIFKQEVMHLCCIIVHGNLFRCASLSFFLLWLIDSHCRCIVVRVISHETVISLRSEWFPSKLRIQWSLKDFLIQKLCYALSPFVSLSHHYSDLYLNHC